MHFRSGDVTYGHNLGGVALERVAADRDLDYDEQLENVIRRAFMIISRILRSFAVSGPSVYLKLHESHVIPILLYASAVWNPTALGAVAKIRKLQRRFLSRVEFRCLLEPNSLEMVDIVDRLDKADMRALRSLVAREEWLDQFFVLHATTSRRRPSIASLSRPRTVKLQQQFAWRVVDKVNRTPTTTTTTTTVSTTAATI